MAAAIWKLSWREGRGLWGALAVLMFGFHWIYVWFTGQMDLSFLETMYDKLPGFLQRQIPVDPHQAASFKGRLAFGYEQALVSFALTAWAVTRGSDAVSGPLGRGTLEMILAQPVRRLKWLLANAVITTFGTLMLCDICWLGTRCGVATVPAFAEISPFPYLWTAANLFSVTFFLAAVATLASACDRHRWRAIGLVSGIYMLSWLIKLVGRAAPKLEWLNYGSFLSLFEPQKLIGDPENIVRNSLFYDGTLIGLGLAAYVAAAVVFARRDLPAPL